MGTILTIGAILIGWSALALFVVLLCSAGKAADELQFSTIRAARRLSARRRQPIGSIQKPAA